MKAREHLSTWTSEGAEQRFRRLEDELVRELVAEPPTPIDVPTRLGPTRAYRWDGDGCPVVFLHGAAGTSMAWTAYAERRGSRPACAIDTIGDVGRSHQEVAVEDAEDLAAWLEEVLVGLGLDRVHLVGTSYGGFLALELAARRPARVRSLCLIEPAGLARVRLARFLLWGSAALLASWLPARPRRAAARALRFPLLDQPRVIRLALQGQLHHRSRLLPAEPLTDEALRSVHHPVLLLIAEKSEAFPADEVKARAEAHLAAADIEVVPNAGHALAVSHQDHVIDRLTAFLTEVGDS
jgi:pimeloyl-ACP methyl ester carboxylesterase